MLPPIKGKIIEAARRAFVDGLITVGVGPDHEVVGILQRRHVPFVTIDGASRRRDGERRHRRRRRRLRPDAHILELGHRRLAILALRPETLNLPEKPYSLVSDRRLAGFAKALGRWTRVDPPEIEVLAVESSLEGGL